MREGFTGHFFGLPLAFEPVAGAMSPVHLVEEPVRSLIDNGSRAAVVLVGVFGGDDHGPFKGLGRGVEVPDDRGYVFPGPVPEEWESGGGLLMLHWFLQRKSPA